MGEVVNLQGEKVEPMLAFHVNYVPHDREGYPLKFWRRIDIRLEKPEEPHGRTIIDMEVDLRLTEEQVSQALHEVIRYWPTLVEKEHQRYEEMENER